MSWSFVLHNESIMQIISEFILISPDSVPVWILPSCSHPRFVLCLPASLQMSFCCTVWTRKFHATPTILLVHTHSPHHHPEKLCQQLTNGELMMPRTITTSHLNSTAYHGDNIQHYLWNLRRFTHQSPLPPWGSDDWSGSVHACYRIERSATGTISLRHRQENGRNLPTMHCWRCFALNFPPTRYLSNWKLNVRWDICGRYFPLQQETFKKNVSFYSYSFKFAIFSVKGMTHFQRQRM